MLTHAHYIEYTKKMGYRIYKKRNAFKNFVSSCVLSTHGSIVDTYPTGCKNGITPWVPPPSPPPVERSEATFLGKKIFV